MKNNDDDVENATLSTTMNQSGVDSVATIGPLIFDYGRRVRRDDGAPLKRTTGPMKTLYVV